MTQYPRPPLPDEPLSVSAPLAREWARHLCHRNDDDGHGCEWFHGLWQYLRLLDITDTSHSLFMTTPRDHATFYLEALRPLIRRGARRVLVSGCADYAMPAYVIWAFATEGAGADLTAVDICRTPLRLCEWYAQRIDAKISTEIADIITYRPSAPFDIICTHSLFGNFSPLRRRSLLEHWRSLLAPGGRVVTVHRVRAGGARTNRGSETQQQGFRLWAEREAEQARHRLAMDPKEFAAMAATYVAARSGRHSIRSAEEFRTLFESCGFRIESLRVGPLTGRAVTNSMSSGDAQYAEVVAARE
jgi:SAM-dependent methyltransferase